MEPTTLYLIDDDLTLSQTLVNWLTELGYQIVSLKSAQEFLETYAEVAKGCLIVDALMSEMSGLELQEILFARKIKLPIIFISDAVTVPTAVRAMKLGALDYLLKPLNQQQLLDSINRGLRIARRYEEDFMSARRWQQQLANLTPRENDVLELMVDGKSTKVIAEILGISPNTAELHRAKVLKKMQVKSLAELISQHLGAKLDLKYSENAIY